MSDKILILNFNSQFTQLIARSVRSAHVFCEIHPYDVGVEFIRAWKPKGIILSGGPNSVTDLAAARIAQEIFTLGCPILGICYGMQMMVEQLGGVVEKSHVREFGPAQIKIYGRSVLFDIASVLECNGNLDVWMSHGDRVRSVPPGFSVVASTADCPIAAIADETRDLYGVQFHPEVTHTPQGRAILHHFVKNICACRPDWQMNDDYIARSVAEIRAEVGDDEVILGLSGGVDSSVTAVLLQRAIGSRLTCVFVDHGLLRLNEAELVMEMLARQLGVKVVQVDAQEIFMGRLAGVTDPEAKRKAIGTAFIEVFQQQAKTLTQAKWLAQGTIYPDVVESAGPTQPMFYAIKSHHNVGGLPLAMNLKLLEPLRSLFKDEVRELGLALGLSHEMIHRHPFPGPGLAVRILGEVKPEYIVLLRLADMIFIDELRATIEQSSGRSWYDLTSQAFAVFLPVKSVGVMGDGRTYEHVIALRAVQTQDFMTACWAHLPHELLGRVSTRIINEVPGINRVVYDISGKPPATIEWE
jgi:GMP synthase (glutamine-hydrolysing)